MLQRGVDVGRCLGLKLCPSRAVNILVKTHDLRLDSAGNHGLEKIDVSIFGKEGLESKCPEVRVAPYDGNISGGVVLVDNVAAELVCCSALGGDGRVEDGLCLNGYGAVGIAEHDLTAVNRCIFIENDRHHPAVVIVNRADDVRKINTCVGTDEQDIVDLLVLRFVRCGRIVAAVIATAAGCEGERHYHRENKHE